MQIPLISRRAASQHGPVAVSCFDGARWSSRSVCLARCHRLDVLAARHALRRSKVRNASPYCRVVAVWFFLFGRYRLSELDGINSRLLVSYVDAVRSVWLPQLASNIRDVLIAGGKGWWNDASPTPHDIFSLTKSNRLHKRICCGIEYALSRSFWASLAPFTQRVRHRCVFGACCLCNYSRCCFLAFPRSCNSLVFNPL